MQAPTGDEGLSVHDSADKKLEEEPVDDEESDEDDEDEDDDEE